MRAVEETPAEVAASFALAAFTAVVLLLLAHTGLGLAVFLIMTPPSLR